LPTRIANREDALLRTRALFVTPRATERRVEGSVPKASSSARVLSRPQHRWVPTRTAACLRNRFDIVWDYEARTELGGVTVAKLDHLSELIRGIDVEGVGKHRRRMERLLRKPQQHRRVLADRVQHHGSFEFSDDLADDPDALRLQGSTSGIKGHV